MSAKSIAILAAFAIGGALLGTFASGFKDGKANQ